MSENQRSGGRRGLWIAGALVVLVLVAVPCIWMVWSGSGGDEQRDTRQHDLALAEIEKLGGRVFYGHEVDADGEPLEDQVEPPGGWDVEGVGEDDADTVATVRLDGARLEGVEFLRGLPDLRYLDLERSKVRNLDGLSGLTQLRVLLLALTEVEDLQGLAHLGELRRLGLRGTQVTDLKPLAKLGKLEFLHLQNTAVSDVRPLAGLSQLQLLVLDRTRVTDVSALSGLTELVWLSLDGTKVQDLTPLHGLRNLERIDIKETTISDEQVAKFRAARPDCYIERVRLSAEELRREMLEALGE